MSDRYHPAPYPYGHPALFSPATVAVLESAAMGATVGATAATAALGASGSPSGRSSRLLREPPAQHYPPGYGPHPGYYAQPAYAPHHHDSGLGSFFNFRDERFVKGAAQSRARC